MHTPLYHAQSPFCLWCSLLISWWPSQQAYAKCVWKPILLGNNP